MRSGSASAAAKELGLTQSAVSRILARLENDLCFDLFMRANGRLVPTSRANEVLLQARTVLEGVAGLNAMSLRNTPVKAPDLTFVTVPSLSYGLIPSVLRDLSSQRADLRYSFDVRTTEAVIDVMLRSAADFAVVALPISHPTLQVTPLFRTVSCAVLQADHPLAEKEIICAQDLVEEQLIFLLNRQPTRQLIEDAFVRTGATPNIKLETSNVATACRCAAEGLGIAVVNAMMAGYSATKDLTMRPFEPRIHHAVALVEPAGVQRSKNVDDFVACMVSEVREKFGTLGLPLDILI